ncbi:NADH dehydrogenase [ubiquinone] 1 alpha subcomplex subunit 7-like [Cataglyphis hispanica]|uniref:NADH dehydrogenase [ubiquinone] 1 alpha subcomplex subunit 7-like n=1 Tax=Cataglyphis hispanica TaxID=1086592 RepID=UPI00217FF92B|nr:NADH dehydrogenase [ubiquinone] 1 alpha subcomplex subunit 7-like [Cataglyphis hispanica]
MPGGVEHRSVTPLIQLIRDLGRGRKVVIANRFPDEQAARTQPPPHVPGGPYHKTSQIYYYTRDARGEVGPPLLISGSKQIGIENECPAEEKYLSPGKTYNWDS